MASIARLPPTTNVDLKQPMIMSHNDDSGGGISHTIPQPNQVWKWPSKAELDASIIEDEAAYPSTLDAEGFCERSSLGFYTFMRFCRQQGALPKILADFVEDVATFKNGGKNRIDEVTARKIFSDYTEDGSCGRSDSSGTWRASGIIRRVTRQNQDGSESAYSYPPNSPLHSRTLTVDSDADSQYSALDSSAFSYGPKRTFQTDWKGYFSRDNAKNAIKVLGGPVNRIEERLRNNDMKSESKEKQACRVSASIFDEVDEIVFGYLKDTYFESFRHSFWWTRYHEFQCLAKKRVVSADFSTLKVLGRGGFGTVNACKRRTTGKEYAMKKLIKKSVKMKKAEAHCMQERNILALIHSPFVVCLKYAYATPTDLYLILDLMNCGDLGFHLSRKGRFSESESKYYAARTLLGLAAMHELDIVHRDIKPENILMDKEGYTKISDLGLACKAGKKGLSGTCGTRGYWAPEMLGKKGKCKRPLYTISVDWFSFGCCLYEFLNGTSPFRTDKGRKWGKFPKIEKADIDRNTDLATQQMEPEYCKLVFTPIAIDLISKLLIKDGKSRLGANGHAEVAAHPWFADIDWENLDRSKPPSAPSASDLSSLAESRLGLFTNDSEYKRVVLTDDDHLLYENWDFGSRSCFEEEVVELLVCEEISGPIVIVDPRDSCCALS